MAEICHSPQTGTPSAIHPVSGEMIARMFDQGEVTMSNERNVLNRAMAAIGAVSMSLAIMVSYFATPQVQAVSGVLA